MGTVNLKTRRLCLRRYETTDAKSLFLHFGSNPNMYVFSGWNPYTTEEMAQNTVNHFIECYKNDRFYGWAIEYNDELGGTVGAYDYDAASNSIEIGISIREDFWGNGFATEALISVLNHLTSSEKIKSVTAWCASENIGSKKAMEKAGMKKVGIEKNALSVEGKTYDKLLFAFQAMNNEFEQELKLLQEEGLKNNPLRKEYEQKVRELSSYREELLNEGRSKDEIARILHEKRRELGRIYKESAPPLFREYILYATEKKYGDPLGPDYESLRKRKTVEQIIESSTRSIENLDDRLTYEGFVEWYRNCKKEHLL